MRKTVNNSIIKQHEVRVYFEDTDACGIVYYANYLHYAERARTEMFRAHGIESSDLINTDGIVLAVRTCNIDYFMPAKLDDSLLIESKFNKIGGASIEIDQTIKRSGLDLVKITIVLACLNLDTGKPQRFPASVLKAFSFIGGEKNY